MTSVTIRRGVTALVAAALVALSFWYVFHSTNRDLVNLRLTHIAWSWVGVAVAANLLAMASQGMRLRPFVNECGRMTPSQAIEMMPVVFATANFLPFRGGEWVKARLLVRVCGISYTASAGAILIDHSFGSAGLIILATGLWITSSGLPWLADFLLGGLLLVAVVAVLILVIEWRRSRRTAAHSRIDRFLHAFAASFRIFAKPPAVARAVVWTAVGWVLELLVAVGVLAALDVDDVWFRGGLMLIGTNAATLLPLTPGQVGLFELAVAFVLKETGVDAATAAIAAVLFHLAHLLPTFLFAGVVMLTRTHLREAMLKRA